MHPIGASAGLGGAIYNQGQLVIEGSTLGSNLADGGDTAQAYSEPGAPGVVSITNPGGGGIGTDVLRGAGGGFGGAGHGHGGAAGFKPVGRRQPVVVAALDPLPTTTECSAKAVALPLTHATEGAGETTGSPSAADPQLGPLADNSGPTKTYVITDSSSAFGAGKTTLTVDQRGEPRPSGAADDIGAFEFRGSDC